MATPTTRKEFTDYCLRRLGAPVVEINVDEMQIDDRVDDALAFYRDYHYDGSERTFLKHQVTAADKTNGYIAVPTTIMGVVNVFPIGAGLNTNNMFNIRYQISLSDVYDWASAQVQNYVSSMERISLLEELFVGKQPLRFNRHTDLPGGLTFNGQTIWQEANDEIIKLEEEVQKKFSMPAMDMIG